MKGVRDIMVVVLYQLNCGKVLDHVREVEGDKYSDYSDNSLK